MGDVVHVSVQKVGLLGGFDLDLSSNRISTFFSNTPLLESILEYLAIIFDLERFLVGLVRIEGFYEARLTEKESEPFDA